MNQKISELTFVTSNEKKFAWVKEFLSLVIPSLTLKQVAFDLPEYQSLDINVVAQAKAREAWQHIQAPLIIDDGGIYFEAYTNFPGPLSKYVFEGIGFDGLFRLITDNPKAYFLTNIVFTADGITYQTFEGILKGHIIQPERTLDKNDKMPFTQIFIPENHSKTLDILIKEQKDQEKNHRFIAIKKLAHYLTQNI